MADIVAGSYGIGQPVRRVEDTRFLTGRGGFIDDFQPAGLSHAVIVLSPHAHARIRGIDASAARKAPGVLCVLTGEDVKAEGLGGLPPNFMPEDIGGPKGLRTRRPILAIDKVRCVGDRWRWSWRKHRHRRAMPPSFSTSTTSRCPRWSTSRTPSSPARPRSGTSARATCRSR